MRRPTAFRPARMVLTNSWLTTTVLVPVAMSCGTKARPAMTGVWNTSKKSGSTAAVETKSSRPVADSLGPAPLATSSSITAPRDRIVTGPKGRVFFGQAVPVHLESHREVLFRRERRFCGRDAGGLSLDDVR